MLNKFQLQNIAFLQPLNLGLVIKQNFCSDLEHKVWSKFWSRSSARFEAGQFFSADLLKRLWSWILVRILKLDLAKNLKLRFYGKADDWLRFWSWCLVEILKMKFDQDLFLNLWYDLNPRVCCAFGNVFLMALSSLVLRAMLQMWPQLCLWPSLTSSVISSSKLRT